MKKYLVINFLLLFIPLVTFATTTNDDPFPEYYNGNYAKAVPGLQKLVYLKDKKALLYLGQMYINGYGVAKNPQKGLQLIIQSAEESYLPAQHFLTQYYLHKEVNVEKAFYWLEKSAELGDVQAQMFCAASYLHGYGVAKNIEKARKYLLLAAQKNNPSAQYELSLLFVNSVYESNRKLGLKWLEKAAESNNADAQYRLGMMLYNGENIIRNIPKGLKWIKSAAANGNIEAAISLGDYYTSAEKTKDNIDEAIKWYEKAAQANDVRAQFKLGSIYLERGSNSYDPTKGHEWIAKAAARNYPEAAYQLAKIYEAGSGVTQNPVLAFKWYLRAANLGVVNAKRQVGIMYYEGIGVSKDKDKALRWLNSAAQSGDPLAKYKIEAISTDWQTQKPISSSYIETPLMISYSDTQIFKPEFVLVNPQNIPLAELIKANFFISYKEKKQPLTVPRYKIANQDQVNQEFLAKLLAEAERGLTQSQFNLAQLYEYGIGVPEDDSKAAAWYLKSAQQGYPAAEYSLALLYLQGKGVKKNLHEALNWLYKAAMKGNIYSQYVLAQIYEHGWGKHASENYIPQNLKEAVSLYNLAAESDFAKAQYNLAEIYASGVVDQDEENHNYQKLASELFEKASLQGLDSAKLGLAFYYTLPDKDHSKQNWAYQVAVKETEKGENNGQLLLALLTDRGIGGDKDKNKAMTLYNKLAQESNPLAQFILGTYYYLGLDVSKDPKIGIEWLTKAADKDFAFALYNLAIINHREASASNANFLNLLQKAAQQNYFKANLLLANYYLTFPADETHIKEGAAIIEKLAKAGDPSAQLKLGYMYEHGINFEKNYKIAGEWYARAASHNNPLAQYLLANLYQVGKGDFRDVNRAKSLFETNVKQNFVPAEVALGYISEVEENNYEKAMFWYLKAATENNPVGQYNLGLMYQYGKGVNEDYDKAFSWYSKAADQGLPQAQYCLGNMYMQGLGIGSDTEKALQWYKKAADGGSARAYYQLGLMYEAGIGVLVDLSTAARYYSKAAESGNANAQVALARFYEFGISTAIDKAEAVKYYQMGADNGNPFAQYQLAHMYKEGFGISPDKSKAIALFRAAIGNQKKEKNTNLLTSNSEHNELPNILFQDFHLESVVRQPTPATEKESASELYMKAIDKLNQGEVVQSFVLFKAILQTYPNFALAQKTYNLIFRNN